MVKRLHGASLCFVFLLFDGGEGLCLLLLFLGLLLVLPAAGAAGLGA